MKKKICVDVDDTVWKFHERFFNFFNKKFGTKHNFDDFDTFYFYEFFGISREEEAELLEEFQNSIFSEDYDLVEDVQKILGEISKHYEIHFVTARPENLREKTIKELKKHFDFDFKIFFTYETNLKPKMTKAEYCKKIGSEIMIEDRFKNAEECAKEGLVVFLLNYTWNNFQSEEKLIRVDKWNEIIKYLEVPNAN